MIKKFSISSALLAAFAVTLGGCAGGEPYVQNTAEYDRESSTFAKGPVRAVESEIYVCYAKNNTTPEQVRLLAEDECGRFGLSAVFIGQNYELCPLMTPIAAGFECAAQTARTAAPNAFQSVPSSVPTNAGAAPVPAPNPIFPKLEVQVPAGAGRQPSASQTGISAGDVSTDAKSQPFPTFLFDNTPRTVTPQ